MSYNALKRDLKHGKEYNALFPTPKGKQVSLGKGDTHTSIKLIIDWALQYNHEVKLVATKLQQGSLSETCFSIHDFLFNHFQYKADGEAQLLRSPARAWNDRYDGIDCKSYSIIASCILLQLGIKHYIRKIKQSAFAPESFTHVYVIVPVNQTSGSLANGYYTIDGTLKSTQEPHYIDKKDFFMDNLKHYGLNGVHSQQGLNGFSYDDVKGAFNTPIACWGGSAFSGERASAEGAKIGAYFEAILNNINLAIRNQNLPALQASYLQFEGVLFTSIKAYKAKMAEGWNDCTEDSIARMQTILTFYEKVVHVGLTAWLVKYFDITPVATKNFTNNADFENLNPAFFFTYTFPNVIYIANVNDFKLKSGVTQIPEFEFTPYVEQIASNPSNFNVETFLQGLSTVLVSFSGNGSTGSGTGAIDENGQNIYDEQNAPKETKSAGMGLLLGGLALVGLATWGFSKMKDTGKGSTTAKKPAK